MKNLRRIGVAILCGCLAAVLLQYFYFLKSLHQMHDFGLVIARGQLDHTFAIRNFSPFTLHIQRVNSSCGCTVVAELPKTVAPFGVLHIPITFDVSVKSGEARSEVYVYFSNSRSASFHLQARVYPPVPDTISLGTFKAGSRIDKSFSLPSSFGAIGSRIRPVAGVTIEKSLLENYTLLRIVITPHFNIKGSFSLPIIQENEEGNETRISTLEGYVLQSVEPESPLISLGYEKEIDAYIPISSRPIKFYSPYQYAFRWLKDRTTDSSSFALTQEDSSQDMITLTIMGPKSRGLYKETLTFSFEIDDGEIVEVPVTVYAYFTDALL